MKPGTIASQWYEGDPNIRRAVDFLTGPQMLAAGHEENLRRLQNEADPQGLVPDPAGF